MDDYLLDGNAPREPQFHQALKRLAEVSSKSSAVLPHTTTTVPTKTSPTSELQGARVTASEKARYFEQLSSPTGRLLDKDRGYLTPSMSQAVTHAEAATKLIQAVKKSGSCVSLQGSAGADSAFTAVSTTPPRSTSPPTNPSTPQPLINLSSTTTLPASSIILPLSPTPLMPTPASTSVPASPAMSPTLTSTPSPATASPMGTVARYSERLKEVEGQLEQAQRKLRVLEAERKLMLAELSRIKSNSPAKDLANIAAESAERCNEMAVELEKSHSRVKELEAQIKELESQSTFFPASDPVSEECPRKLREMEVRLQQAEGQLTAQLAKNSVLSEKADIFSVERVKLEETISQLKNQLEATKNKLEATTAECVQLRTAASPEAGKEKDITTDVDEKSTIQDENNQLKERIAHLQTKLELQKIRAVSPSNPQADTQKIFQLLLSLQQKVDSVDNKISSQPVAGSFEEEDITTLKMDVVRLHNELREKQIETEKSTAREQEIKMHLVRFATAVQEKIESLNHTNAELSSQLSESHTKLKLSKASNSELFKELESCKSQLQDTLSQKEKLQQSLQQELIQHQNLQQKLSDLVQQSPQPGAQQILQQQALLQQQQALQKQATQQKSVQQEPTSKDKVDKEESFSLERSHRSSRRHGSVETTPPLASSSPELLVTPHSSRHKTPVPEQESEVGSTEETKLPKSSTSLPPPSNPAPPPPLSPTLPPPAAPAPPPPVIPESPKLLVSKGASSDSEEEEPPKPTPQEVIDKQKYLMKKTIDEVLESEEIYVSSLETLINIFMKPLQGKDFCSRTQLQQIFSQVEIIKNYNNALLRQLRTAVQTDPESPKLGPTFLFICGFLKVYNIYVSNYETAVNTLTEMQKNSPEFVEWLETTQKKPECQNLDIYSFLIQPVQRIPRYVMLLQTLSKASSLIDETLRSISSTPPAENDDVKKLRMALTQMQSVADVINEKKKEAESQLKVRDIAKKLVGKFIDPYGPGTLPVDKKGPSLTQPQRRFIHADAVGVLVERKLRPRYLILFNDILLETKTKSGGFLKNSGEQYQYESSAQVFNAAINDDDESVPNGFRLAVLFNNKPEKERRVFIISCETPEAKREFLDKLHNCVDLMTKNAEIKQRKMAEAQSESTTPSSSTSTSAASSPNLTSSVPTLNRPPSVSTMMAPLSQSQIPTHTPTHMATKSVVTSSTAQQGVVAGEDSSSKKHKHRKSS
ncbi:Guanine exchange factor for Rac 30 [Pelomyxa schiedti]|nr:Guanine exchange factor for Rac 30 [Pelomyxa schiedti]